jgi:DNA-binding GntR family transcriptional regulator
MLLRDNIYDALRTAILTCELLPNQELREQDLAARYRVSRSPVRDALLRLEKERLVTVLPRQGYRVTPIARTDAAEIFGLRLVIEPACAAAAAQQRDTSALDVWRDIGQLDFVAYNRGFHAALAELSANARMAAVAQDMVEQSDRLIRFSLASTPVSDRGRLVAEHAAIIDAVQAGDADAAERLMRAHVRQAQDRVLNGLEKSQGDILQGNAA